MQACKFAHEQIPQSMKFLYLFKKNQTFEKISLKLKCFLKKRIYCKSEMFNCSAYNFSFIPFLMFSSMKVKY